MPFTAQSNTIVGDVSSDTIRTRAHAIPVDVSGMLPNAKYAVRLDGVDYSWACKPFGGMMGDPIQADAKGKVSFIVYAEIPYAGQFSADAVPSQPQSASGYNVNQQDVFTYSTSNRVLELIGPGQSYGYCFIPVRSLIAPSH